VPGRALRCLAGLRKAPRSPAVPCPALLRLALPRDAVPRVAEPGKAATTYLPPYLYPPFRRRFFDQVDVAGELPRYPHYVGIVIVPKLETHKL